MEYRRYSEFINDENMYEFSTHLPIQLDATCNGFQHLALLSNESILFSELNLVSNGKLDEIARDFYNFFIYKLEIIFDGDPDNENYQRLRKFVFDRTYLKKAIMTIPYNVSRVNMTKYILENLTEVIRDKVGL